MNYYASEMCPVGCGEVIFLKARDTGLIFCHCTGCGCNWDNPEHAQIENGLNEINAITKFAKEGVVLPVKDEIVCAGYGAFIIDHFDGEAAYTADEINEYAYKNT
jgi:hypothetical protein